MPVVLRYEGYKFFFYSNEGQPREPVHVHVRKGERKAKFWLEPEVCLVEAYRMNSRELRRLLRVIVDNRDAIREAWDEHFGH